MTCLSRHYPLRDFAPRDAIPWSAELAAPAVCPDSAELTLPTTAKNWILRQADGHVFLIDGDSHLHNIQDGGTYIACAQNYLVLDFVGESMVRQFGDPANAPPAPCQ